MRGKRMEGFPEREKALSDFFNAWSPHTASEFVPLSEAAGRITSQALYSQNTLPVHRVSGCDGISVRAADFTNGVPDYSQWQEEKEFARADTGDDFDDRFDAVIPIEEVDFTAEGRISFISPDVPVATGSNVRPRGSSFAQGDLLMKENRPIRPMDLASLAMGGIAMVPVWKRPRVAFIPTGSELIPYGMHPKRGQNIDTNSIMVQHMLLEMGAEPVIFPIVPDAPAELENRLMEALSIADVVIINAGSAKGGEDFNIRLLENKGRMIHHYIAAAPGRPMALAVIDTKPVINLPGPTMAAFFGTDWCIRAVVNRFLGIPLQRKPRIKGVLMEDIRSTPHMAILCRINAVKTEEGYACYPLSFHMMSLPLCMASNAMYISPVGESVRQKGDAIEVELLIGEEYL